MIENIRLSFQGIWSHKMRSFLTMLGIIIGIASIISIVSTIKGTNEQIKANLIGSGDNTIPIKLNQGEGDYEMDEYSEMPEGVPPVSDDTMEQIRELDYVENATMYQFRTYVWNVYYKDTEFSGGQLRGIDERYFNTCGYIFRNGRDFTEEDHTKFRKTAILDENAADSFLGETEPIGKTIEIGGDPYVVIGVVEKMDKFEPVINSMDDYYLYTEQQGSGTIFIPRQTWPVSFRFDEPQNVIVKTDDIDHMTQVSKAAADLLNKNVTNQNSIKYKAEDFLKDAQKLQSLSDSTNQQLLWIASISLLVGGIGVMNIMLVSVTERTREIGLKKAIGARKRKIMIQFLTEASVLTSIGGIIGVLAGLGLSQVISKVSQTPVAVSIPAIIGSVVFSILIGVIFGLLPSFKAASLNPIDALRYE